MEYKVQIDDNSCQKLLLPAPKKKNTCQYAVELR